MPFDGLGESISLLEKRKPLTRVHAPVPPLLEITEITDRVGKGAEIVIEGWIEGEQVIRQLENRQ